MAFGIMTIVHAVLGFMLIVELGLTGYVVHASDGGISQYNFMLFNSIWTILVLLYLAVVPAVLKSLYNGIVALALITLTTLFWFAGAIAEADHIGVPNCHGYNFCQCVQASVAFGFFIWAIFTGITAMEALAFFKGGARVDASRKPGQPYPGV